MNAQVNRDISIFVISLPQAKERRSFMKRQLENLHLHFEFIDAVI